MLTGGFSTGSRPAARPMRPIDPSMIEACSNQSRGRDYNRLMDTIAASDLRYAEALYRCNTDRTCEKQQQQLLEIARGSWEYEDKTTASR